MYYSFPIKQNDDYISSYVAYKLFTDKQCDAIVEHCNKQDLKKATTVGGDKEYRQAHITWMYPENSNDWFYQRIQDFALDINQKYWRFDVQGIGEMQYTEYRGNSGGKYDYHTDFHAAGLSLRKLTVVTCLHDKYEGGEFIMVTQNDSGRGIVLKKGQSIIFPSFEAHAVKPVTKGDRKVMVTWIHGPPFR